MTEGAIREALAALGVDAAGVVGVLDPPRERVYESLRAGWLADKRMPPIARIADECGVAQSTVSHALDQLMREGRVLFVRRGVWVPVTARE